MTVKAWMQTLTGRSLTMAQPAPNEIDPLMDLPEMLARLCRFNGAIPSGLYSVAQHSVLIADAILDERQDAQLAAIGLLHDGHEYVWGDVTTPQQQGLGEIEAELYGDSRFKAVLEEAKRRADVAIFKACGVPWPPAPHHLRIVKSYDLRMVAMERQHLLAPSVRRWAPLVERADPIRMRGSIRPWPIAVAADAFRDRLKKLCPALTRRGQS